MSGRKLDIRSTGKSDQSVFADEVIVGLVLAKKLDMRFGGKFNSNEEEKKTGGLPGVSG